jgi:hypothetical protein
MDFFSRNQTSLKVVIYLLFHFERSIALVKRLLVPPKELKLIQTRSTNSVTQGSTRILYTLMDPLSVAPAEAAAILPSSIFPERSI